MVIEKLEQKGKKIKKKVGWKMFLLAFFQFVFVNFPAVLLS